MDAELQGLVARAQGGDREAFGELYERLAPKVYGYLYHHTSGQTQLAEDLSEEVFVKVLERLQRYQNRGLPFTAWVYRIAHNHLVDHFRAQPKQGSVSIEACSELAERGAEKTLEDALTNAELANALRKLTEDQRQVLVLRFLQGMNLAQTAAAVGKSQDAVKKLQARGLQALRRGLGTQTLADLAA
jgi:RNA polymerase sigma-70 factor, ECF subfamily